MWRWLMDADAAEDAMPAVVAVVVLGGREMEGMGRGRLKAGGELYGRARFDGSQFLANMASARAPIGHTPA